MRWLRMDDFLLKAIDTVGFPIVACVILFWQNMKQADQFDKQLMELEKVIENNTNVLIELSNKINGGK